MEQKIINPPHLLEFDGMTIYTGTCKYCPKKLVPWIRQFVQLPRNAWLVPIEKEWIGDWFNQYGIDTQFENFGLAIELITDSHSDQWRTLSDEKICRIHLQAMKIYGLMHARWIVQPKGLALMKEKYERGLFGKCPRYSCRGVNLLPVGTTFSLRKHSAKVFCPMCRDIYRPTNMFIDGAYFGSAFPHMFLFEYKDFDRSDEFKPFQRTAFGFKIRKTRHDVHDFNIYEGDDAEE